MLDLFPRSRRRSRRAFRPRSARVSDQFIGVVFGVLRLHPARYAISAVVLGAIALAALFSARSSRLPGAPVSAPGGAALQAHAALMVASDSSQRSSASALLAPTAQSEQSEGAVPPADAPTSSMYVVQDGDTVRSIAAQFGVSAETVEWANDLTHPDLISVGQKLAIPPVDGVLYHARGGETLRELASRYHGDVAEIAAYNHLDLAPDDAIPPGDLVVPGGRRDDFVAEPLPSPTAEEVVQANPSQNNVTALGESQALPADTPSPAKPKQAPITYEVKEGDTLQSLALLFGVDVDTLLNANNIENPDLVTVGTRLTVLPVPGVEYTVEDGETLADIAQLFEVDGGRIADVNGISDPNFIRSGDVLIIPGAKTAHPVRKQPPAAGDSSTSGDSEQPADQEVQDTSGSDAVAESKPAPDGASAAVSGGGSAIVENAMAHLGQAYVWGGIGPRGFDCSGFVYYIHQVSGFPVSRGLWGQLNGGPRISIDELEPGDTVFFANTYEPGLSHAGIYIGGGQFIHASDPSTGVTISNLSSPYWSSRYVGASRLW